MSRRSRRKQETHDDSHRWVISYADFITLLFAFFVVMYAISSVNVSKYRALSEGMQQAFNKKDERRPSTVFKDQKKTSVTVMQENTEFNALDNALSDLQDSDFMVTQGNGWIEMDIKAASLFESASADLKPSAFAKIMKLAGVLQKMDYPITIEGYTDNVPIQTTQFPSNWELSSARAAAVARMLVSFGIDRARITITGYGDQYPVSPNDSKEGRAKNRRVNVILAKDKSVPRLLNPSYTETKSMDSKIQPIKMQPKGEVQ